jgi:hypothetical protein
MGWDGMEWGGRRGRERERAIQDHSCCGGRERMGANSFKYQSCSYRKRLLAVELKSKKQPERMSAGGKGLLGGCPHSAEIGSVKGRSLHDTNDASTPGFSASVSGWRRRDRSAVPIRVCLVAFQVRIYSLSHQWPACLMNANKATSRPLGLLLLQVPLFACNTYQYILAALDGFLHQIQTSASTSTTHYA